MGHKIALKAIKRNLLDDKFQNSYKTELNALKKLQISNSKVKNNEEHIDEINEDIQLQKESSNRHRSKSFDQELCFLKEQINQLYNYHHSINTNSNIIQFVRSIDNYSFTFNSKLYSCHAIFMEYAKNGCLGEIMQSPKFTNLPITIFRRIAAQLFEGIKEMHLAHLVHRDIKEDNIVFGEQYKLKIIDLSFAGRSDNQVCGTQKYISPEVLKLEFQQLDEIQISENSEQKNTLKEKKFKEFTKIDTFAAGVVLFRLATKIYPFNSASKFDYRYKHIFNKQYDLFWRDVNLILTEHDTTQPIINFSEYLNNYNQKQENPQDLDTSSNSVDNEFLDEDYDGEDQIDESDSQNNQDGQNNEQNDEIDSLRRSSRKIITYIKSKRALSQIDSFLTQNELQFFAQLMNEQTTINGRTSPHKHSYSQNQESAFTDQIEQLRDLIQGLLAFNVEDRLSIEEAIEHPFFTSYPQHNCCKYIATNQELKTFIKSMQSQ